MRIRQARAPWSEQSWERVHAETTRQVATASSSQIAWSMTARQARTVLRVYSTSFFLVTRFLPRRKREKVEVIYAAVRYPDEIVDTFPLPPADQLARLETWRLGYERGLQCSTMADAVASGVPALLAAFTLVVRDQQIPPEHYRAFLQAMRLDATPGAFESLDDLIETYIYGSAVVVGIFLAHVYGPSRRDDFARALRSARELAIALQLTNFLRDVSDDERRGRVYLPQTFLRAEGIDRLDTTDATQHRAIQRVILRISQEAETRYARAARDLDAFAADSQPAIRACIDVYRRLNTRIAASPRGLLHRERVPFMQKYRALPASKYWRLPLEYLTSPRIPSW